MGPYCDYCHRRCFLPRVIHTGPRRGESLLMATCGAGMAHDLEVTGHTHVTALNPVTQADAVAALAAGMRGEDVPAAVQRITTRDDLVALANELGMRRDWHEPDERGVTVIPYGYDFDNAGHWGTDLRFEMERQGQAGSVERYVVIFQHDKPVAEVNLATLFAFAAGFEG